MNDWRLYNETFFKGIKLHKIRFPEFWKDAYQNKNDFYDMIKNDAYDYVEKYHTGSEYLEGEKIRKFWHTHCEMCTDKITTDEQVECYCTEDYQVWVCKTCFSDFKEYFGWDDNF